MRAVVVVATLGAALVSCGTPHSRLKRVLLWHGEADCTACQAQAITLWPDGPPAVSLKADSVYTAQLEMDVPGDPDRCVFQFAGGSWELPSHGFCDPEQATMRRAISTRRYSFPSAGDRLGIRVSVLSSTDRRSLELLLDFQYYDVTWIP